MGDEAPGWGRMCIRRRGGRQQRSATRAEAMTMMTTTPLPPRFRRQRRHRLIRSWRHRSGSGGQWDVVTLVRYTDLACSVFSWGYLLVFLVSSSFSSSTGAGADKDMSSLGVAQYSLGTYGGGGGGKGEGKGKHQSDYDTNKMAKMTMRGYRYPALKTAAAGGVDDRR